MPRHGDNIRKRNDGRWEGRFRHKSKDGSYKYKSVYGKTYHEVKERMNEMLMLSFYCTSDKEAASINESEHLLECSTPKILFGVVAEQWLIHVKETRKYSTYIKYFKLYDSYIKEYLQEVYVLDVSSNTISEKIFSEKYSHNYSSNQKHSIISVINQILKYANEYHKCSSAQIPNKRVKRHNDHIEIMSHSDQATLLKYLYQNIDASKAGIILCISTGLRLGEICSLRWEDIDFEQMIIHVNSTVQRIALLNQNTKTGLMVTPPKSATSMREIPISSEIKELLCQIKDHEQVYVLGKNKPMEPRTYQNHFKKYLRETNIKAYNFHALRHTFATNCIDAGMDAKSLSEILGHSDVQITLNRYVHPTMDTKRRYIAALSSVYSQYCGQNATNANV